MSRCPLSHVAMHSAPSDVITMCQWPSTGEPPFSLPFWDVGALAFNLWGAPRQATFTSSPAMHTMNRAQRKGSKENVAEQAAPPPQKAPVKRKADTPQDNKPVKALRPESREAHSMPSRDVPSRYQDPHPRPTGISKKPPTVTRSKTEPSVVKVTPARGGTSKAGLGSGRSLASNPNFSFSAEAQQAEQAQAELREQVEDNMTLTSDNEKLQGKLNALEDKYKAIKADLEKERAAKAEELEKERAARAEEEAQRAKVENELAVLSTRLAEAESAASAAAAVEASLRFDKTALEGALAERESEVETLAVRAREQEVLRRKMHETISELKGNIRVFCRVRPAASSRGATSLVRVPSGQLEPTNLELVAPSDGSAASPARPQRFKFDRVFAEGANQADVFNEVSQLTQSALDGYKVCIFAYGQTGSGKTHTMQGARGELRGVVPRAAEQVFATSVDLALLGWTFEFYASCLEIYNEELRDLLPGESKKADVAKLKISDANGLVTVPGLSCAKVEDAASLEALLTAAAKVRATSATKINADSSRSHYVFRMSIKGRNPSSGESIDGELNLIDLAGSERTKDSGVVGDALREANCINKSLSSLGDVISALGDAKAKHVPYRNSKLTHVLQNALAGSAKTLMFVNVNPAAHQESLSSLRFAAKVGGVEIGPATQSKHK